MIQPKKNLELSDDGSDADDNDTTGKKSKLISLNRRKNSKKQETIKNSSNLRQSHIDNQSSNISSFKSWSAAEPQKSDQKVKDNASIASSADINQQQQNSSFLGVSDRISKEKQKFFRFSVFNIERKSKFDEKKTKRKLGKNSSNVATDQAKSSSKPSGQDKYEFTSNSDSSCDTKIKHKSRNNSIGKFDRPQHKNLPASLSKKPYGARKNRKEAVTSTDEESQSSCCSSDNETSSVSSTSTDSTSSSTDASSSHQQDLAMSSYVGSSQSFKTDTINTMNVFACINSREFLNSEKKSNCWSSLPFAENQKLDTFQKQKQTPMSRSFGFSSTLGSDIWGFAAVAQKPVNVFDSASETKTISEYCCSTSDNASSSLNSFHNNKHSLPSTLRKRLLKHPNEYFVKSRRSTTLMNNNVINSSDEEATTLSPSKLFKKAVTYKKFDTFSSKCLLMGANGQNEAKILNTSYEMDNSNQSTNKCSQSPYTDNNQFDLGKNSNES